jgi:Transcriptional regulators
MALATKHRDKPHARIYAEWMLLPAWRTLDCHARALIVELLTRYRPTDENHIILSDRKAATMLNCARPTAAKAIAQLVERGWLEIERVGSMKGPRCKRGSAYALTAQPAHPGLRAELTFMNWQEPANGKE